MTSYFKFSFLTASCFLFLACAPKYSNFEMSEARFQKQEIESIPGFHEENFDEVLQVFLKTCEKSSTKKYLEPVCVEAKKASNAKQFFIDNFIPYKVINTDGTDKGLITAYYEPVLFGSRTKTARFKYPVLKSPKDLLTVSLASQYPEFSKYNLRGMNKDNRVIPYFTREEIEKNSDQFEPLCFVDNKIDLFFLQIQGSGKIFLDTNETINVGYANQNGHQYYSIGQKLLTDPVWSKGGITMQKIKEWAQANSPETVDALLHLNKSYIFFKENQQGATGSLGVELVPGRHIAVDTRYIPLGLPLFLTTLNPLTNEPIQKLVVAADTGGAIKGAVRADLFYGFGEIAGEYAGKMKQSGEMIVFIPKNLIIKAP